MPATETLQVEMFPASHGDAFLVRCFSEAGLFNILIDAGPAATYRDKIKPRLEQLASAGEVVNLFIVTHVDSDHIKGALDFINDNGPSAAPNVIAVRDVWHNSYRHLPFEGRPATPDEVKRVNEQVSAPPVPGPGDITARQGTTLAALLRKHQYPWNEAFGAKAVVTSSGRPTTVSLNPAVTLTLLSPVGEDLKNLARLWRRELMTMGVEPDAVDAIEFESAFEARLLATFSNEESVGEEEPIAAADPTSPPDASTFVEDRSVTNRSSIAFLLRCGTKSALFLGDAHPSPIVGQLRAISPSGPLDVDLLKVSHHGSRRNTSPDLLAAVKASHCLISTDGSKHGHPDIEALLWIIASQPKVSMHFNYPTAAANKIGRPKMLKRYEHAVNVEQSRRSLVVVI